MKIGIVGPTHPIKGGVAQHTTAMATELARAGHQVEIISWANQYPRRLYPGVQTVDRPELPPFEPVERMLSWNRPDTWVRAGRRLRHMDLVILAHITHVQAIPYLIILAALGFRRPQTRIIAHNVLPHERSAVDRPLIRALFRAGQAIVVHSEPQAELARQLTKRPVRFARLPPFMPDSFVAGRPEEGEHRRLLFFGIVRPYKGVDVLIRALAEAPPDVQLRIAGEFWGGTSDIERLCHEAGVADRVELISGYVDAEAVVRLFEDVDALVLPYRSATGSQAVWTAFQFGVPAIATSAGHLADDIRPGIDGLVVAPGDPHELAAGLREFYSPGRPEAMRQQVRPVDPEPLWEAYLATLLG